MINHFFKLDVLLLLSIRKSNKVSSEFRFIEGKKRGEISKIVMFKNKFSKADKAAKKQAQQPVFKQDYFSNCHRTYSCIHCRAHLANHDELISKLFQGNQGRAYLFNRVVNIGCKQAVQRELLTGLHAVADIYCDNCETTLGWKYEQAFVPSQKYKEGKYIIELVHMLKENDWDLTSYNARELLRESNSVNDLNLINNYKVGDNYIGPPNKYKLFSSQLRGADKNNKAIGNGNGNAGESTRDIYNIDRDRMYTFESKAITSPVLTTTPKNFSLGKQILDVKSCPPILGSQNEKSEMRENKRKEDSKEPIIGDNGKLEKENIELTERSNINGNRMHTSITTTDNLNLLSTSSKNSLGSSRSQSDVSSYVSITDNSTSGSGRSNSSSRTDGDLPYELCPMSQSNILNLDVKTTPDIKLSSSPTSSKNSSSSFSLTRDIPNETNKDSFLASETRIELNHSSTAQINPNMNNSVL